ncbi:MAG: D-glycero-beta-D-manno-heptose 1,7-bisphosphate 7-phosphatase [Planctomycetales bacterium]|nr:D-glycero-beta-D-manno-heptose 1,7-bisphosphate 7-phosphatase [Planctomycetales bacterium]
MDRDGVLNEDRGFVHRREDFHLLPGVRESLRALSDAGWALVVVTNQSGIGRGLYELADFHRLTEWMCRDFARAGAPLSGVYFCPHHPDAHCRCRKPAPGLLLEAAYELGLSLADSWLVGDRLTDLEAGRLAGVPRRVLVHACAASDQLHEGDQVAADLAAATQKILETSPVHRPESRRECDV